MIRIKLVIILNLLLSQFGRDEMYFREPQGILHYKIDLTQKELYKELESGRWNKFGVLTLENIILKDIPDNPTIFSFREKSDLLLTVEGTGQVYRLDINQLKLVRLDKTFFRGFNFASIQFFRNGFLHSYGGNGFWHTNNIETYFSFKSNEWELKNAPDEKSPRRMKNDFGGYDNKRDIISVIEFPDLYQKGKASSMRYFEKDFSNGIWNYKGDIDCDFLNSLGLKNMSSIFLNGCYFFLSGPLMVWADPEKNEIYQLKEVDPRFNSFFEYSGKGNMIYSYQNNKIGKFVQVDSISIEKIKSLSTYKGHFYVKPYPSGWVWYVVVLCIIGLCLGGYFFLRKKEKIATQASSIESFDGMLEGTVVFLKACLAFPCGHVFSSQVFTEMMGYGTYAYETQRQVRSKMIKEINSYFWAHYRMKDVIIRQTASDDKRFSVYQISEEHYETLKNLLNSR